MNHSDDDSRRLTVNVALGPRSYDVVVTHDRPAELSATASAWLERSWAGRSCRRALIMTDEHVATLPPVANVRDALGALKIEVETVAVPPGEASKGLATASELYDRLIAMKADRHTLIVAVGGGVIGDLAGFVAATYARGLPLVMVPTTLLSQVDSSVGGKVGVNHPQAKNIIGAFHQPIGVWIDTATLDTLPVRELRCGLAEVVKYGVILDAPFFEELEGRAGEVLDRRPEALRRIIARSCELKAMVVTQDEREETGLRAVLNFGHTIGHAVEAVAGYGGGFQHGEAVAVGMVAECRLAERLGWIGPDLTARLTTLLERFGLPTSLAGLDPEALLDAMGRDKKNRDGRIRLVLPRRLGAVELTDAATIDDLLDVLRDLCRTAS
ncbi:3-dehydroquinate synthase [Paludisphaera borealis]|uniref:3-dehydroquinate synthase n=1 Tax=Paludisphaera borealis TaxID=1387353 RepID=A0A1U7CM39_9BACT|nr:3-dehydroquinate synthase [Paludisphaera borealis]APW59976.1 3-dehydroquinate synthase [Paludisphaera borealis]